MKPLMRGTGRHKWDAKVAGTLPGKTREIFWVTVFSDNRDDAITDACDILKKIGYIGPTVDYIMMIH